jgi:tetratricopeptide (TPR) repeat protein
MTRRRITFAGALAALVAAASLLGGLLAESASVEAPPAAPDVAAGQLLQGFSPADTASYVARLERRVADDGADADALMLLGLAYQQRARETGDQSFLSRAKEALRRALAVERGDVGLRDRRFLIVSGLSALAASQHRFRRARVLGEQARRASPASAAPYGVLADALIELGRYREGFAAVDRMVSIKPSLAAYARVSYARELLGHTGGAVEAMKLAVEAGSARPEPAAWASVQLGNLFFNSGRLRAARRAYSDALVRLPGYVHARAGVARVAAADGNYRRAIALYRRTVDALPLPQYAIALGDVLRASGRTREAGEAYELVAAMQRLAEANGVRTELDSALFDLDHDRRLADALARAREAYRAAPSIHADDVLAWALYKNGRCEEARTHSRRALRLGTRDALKLFHRGMIERCVGNRATGRRYLERALAVNPHFSLLYGPVAREAAR